MNNVATFFGRKYEDAAPLYCPHAAILISLVSHVLSGQANSAPPVLRGRGLEIVDDHGKVRASIQVIPAGPARRAVGSVVEPNGKIYPEAVLLRLIRPDGRLSVKIETTEQGSGLDLSGGVDPTYIVLKADDSETTVTLTNTDARRQTLKS